MYVWLCRLGVVAGFVAGLSGGFSFLGSFVLPNYPNLGEFLAAFVYGFIATYYCP